MEALTSGKVGRSATGIVMWAGSSQMQYSRLRGWTGSCHVELVQLMQREDEWEMFGCRTGRRIDLWSPLAKGCWLGSGGRLRAATPTTSLAGSCPTTTSPSPTPSSALRYSAACPWPRSPSPGCCAPGRQRPLVGATKPPTSPTPPPRSRHPQRRRSQGSRRAYTPRQPPAQRGHQDMDSRRASRSSCVIRRSTCSSYDQTTAKGRSSGELVSICQEALSAGCIQGGENGIKENMLKVCLWDVMDVCV